MDVLPPPGDIAALQERRGLAVGRGARGRAPAPGRIRSRRRAIAVAKRVLPMLALALLATIVLWPEVTRWAEQARLRAGRFAAQIQTGLMTDPVYHGVDQRGRPFTVTADHAREASADRVDLVNPKGDVGLQGGRWLMVQARRGVYMQHLGSLDLSGDVQLYRDDGTTMDTHAATVDLKAGAAASADMVHAEGPFGTLDAQGFTMTDHGTAIQFAGPGRLVMNGRR